MVVEAVRPLAVTVETVSPAGRAADATLPSAQWRGVRQGCDQADSGGTLERAARSPGQSRLRRRSCGRDLRQFGGKREVLEDPLDAVRIVDGGEQRAPTAAVGAKEHVDEEQRSRMPGRPRRPPRSAPHASPRLRRQPHNHLGVEPRCDQQLLFVELLGLLPHA